jgi:Phosphatidylinositol N-acetylglucosaminyltransferase
LLILVNAAAPWVVAVFAIQAVYTLAKSDQSIGMASKLPWTPPVVFRDLYFFTLFCLIFIIPTWKFYLQFYKQRIQGPWDLPVIPAN